MRFTAGLDTDLRDALLNQLRSLWSHTSTAIEGNTLTLGETEFVLREGLTVSGKPLKDHQEVIGHARAIDLIYALVDRPGPVSAEDLFALHRAVQTEVVHDIYKPIGDWKKEESFTNAVSPDGKAILIEYSKADAVPLLMQDWLALLNRYRSESTMLPQELLRHYAALHISFVRIHPFFDGNGRVVRLIANVPVLAAGQPPIIIPREKRYDYIRLLTNYHHAHSQLTPGAPLVIEDPHFEAFVSFCREAWQATLTLVDQARAAQQRRSIQPKG